MLLIVIGTLVFFSLEYNNPKTIASLSLPHKILASYFQAVTPRTAGFNTLPIEHLLPATALFTMFLMFVGASPGGTGGGVKTSTFALIIATILATLRGLKNTIMFGRRIPAETVRRAFTIFFLALTVVMGGILALNSFEHFGLMEEAFEIFSAFGTVGLSRGITPLLSPLGKIVIIVVMFIGRVGPLTLLLSLMLGQKESRLKPPKEGISIG
jgi:trk system potassium uptake protein TrkH